MGAGGDDVAALDRELSGGDAVAVTAEGEPAGSIVAIINDNFVVGVPGGGIDGQLELCAGELDGGGLLGFVGPGVVGNGGSMCWPI